MLFAGSPDVGFRNKYRDGSFQKPKRKKLQVVLNNK
jgi:hypothetical protein